MVELLTFLKVTKLLVASKMFHQSTGSFGYSDENPHFYDDPVPGDSFPHNMFHFDGHGPGGSHAGTYRNS